MSMLIDIMKKARYTTCMAKKTTTTRKATSRKVKNTKVDIYPNRMTLAVSALAGTTIILFILLAETL